MAATPDQPIADTDVYPELAPTGERKPITTQRSRWIEGPCIAIGPIHAHAYFRRTGDGELKVIVGQEPQGWHLSISFTDHRGRPSRYPRWDEIADARECFTPDEITMAMILPPSSQYVAVHDTCFHLHQVEGEQS